MCENVAQLPQTTSVVVERVTAANGDMIASRFISIGDAGNDHPRDP
jgi:hypothetical protein